MVIETFRIVNDFTPVICQPYLKCLKVHMICMTKADLLSQKWTQHYMDWNRLSIMDPIFGIYFWCILNQLCLFVNSRNFSQNGWSWGRGIEFKFFLAWSSKPQLVCQQAFNRPGIWCLRTWVRILHSAGEDNLSPFNLKIACLCQSIEINNNKLVYCIYIVYMLL